MREGGPWTLSESVIVKPGVIDQKTGRAIGGWQGRIRTLPDEAGIVTIQWDSVTLKSMTQSLLAWTKEECLPWSEMKLPSEDLERATVRDSEGDVAALIAELETQTNWPYLKGEQGQRIQAIVSRARGHDEFAVFRSWHAFLEERLAVPFAAIVQEAQRGPIPQGAQIRVLGVIFLDETYGTIMKIKYGKRSYALPLREVRVTDANAETQQAVEDYAVWFAHHRGSSTFGFL